MLRVFEFGCGVKFFTGESMGFRLEYRHRNYSGEGLPAAKDPFNWRSEMVTRQVDVQFDALMLGFDVYF